MDAEKPLAGQIAVITGAARGIGEALARTLAGLGAHTLLIARDRDRLDAVAARIAGEGGSAEAFPLDLRDVEAVEAMGDTVRTRHGRCDVLVNNAAIGNGKQPLHAMEPERWNELMETNLRGPYLTIRALAPLMIEARSGHIINISSLAGHNPLPNGAAYSASKWGLNGLTYSVAEELRQYGIRVSVIAPGSVNTGFDGGQSDSARAPRMIQPDDVAMVVAMLVRQAPQSFVSEVLLRPTSKS